MTLNANKIFIALVIIILLLGGVVIYEIHTKGELKDDYAASKTALSNTFTKALNAQGQEIATVKAAVFASSKNAQDIVAQLNKNGANIQSKIDGQTQSLTLIDKKIGGIITGKSTVAGYDTVKNKYAGRTGGSKDSLKKNDSLTVWPIYSVADSTKWYTLNGIVGHDHFKIVPYFKDSTELKFEMVKNGFLKPRVLTATSLSKNPFSVTTGFKSLVVQKQPAPVVKYIAIVGALVGGIVIGAKVSH